MNWNDIFSYDETSSTCLRWRINIYKGPKLGVISIRKGEEAGCKKRRSNGDGRDCIRVSYCNRAYPTHRIIWEMFNGTIPKGMVIDHLNGDAWDNRIDNLACKTRKENNQNKKKRSDNTSGFTGVKWWVVDGLTYAVACMGDKRKTFSVQTNGLIPAFYMACQYRELLVKMENENGSKFTERNGK